MTDLYIGMDIHKSSSSFCIMNRSGDILAEQRLPTTAPEITKFIKVWDRQYNLTLTLEPVGQWYVYVDLLESLQVTVILADPRRLKALTAARAKTDKLDARVLADHLRTDHLPKAYLAPKEVRRWREIVRSRSSLVKVRTEVKNQVHALLFRHGHRSPPGGLFTLRGRSWLKELELEPHAREILDHYLSVIEHLDGRIKDQERRIKSLVSEHPDMSRLRSIPGIGDILALTIMAEIGDVNRFRSYKQLQAYAGLVPWVRNSGDKSWSGRLTKTGSSWLRYAAVEAAVGVSRTRRSSDLKDYFRRIKLRKNHQTAVVATARKLLAIVWSGLKNQREFQPRYPAV